MELLRGLADDGAAVVFITHDMRLVAEYADRAAVLCDGEIVFNGTNLVTLTDVDTQESWQVDLSLRGVKGRLQKRGP